MEKIVVEIADNMLDKEDLKKILGELGVNSEKN